jgi:chemotaxis protein methyltransferase CheR
MPDGSQAFASDLALTNADFSRVKGLIYSAAGINLNTNKQNMVFSRLSKFAREHGGFTPYLDWLERSGTADAWQTFINSLTTNLTSFFREQHHFPILADLVRGKTSANVWCCAASTGEEPYSIAMTLLEAAAPGARLQLFASDIDTNCLTTAAAGVYRDESIKTLNDAQLRRHFQRGTGANAGFVRVRPELKRVIEFGQVNLLAQKWTHQGSYDAIFCRNVMIYFDKPTQLKVLERLAGHLPKGGLLFAGHSENFTEAKHLFRLIGKTVYERV